MSETLDDFRISEIELTYHNYIPPIDRYKVDTPRLAYQLFLKTWNPGQIDLLEQFKVMLLDTSCRMLGIATVSTGGISHCIADQRLIFATALKGKASQLILAHNHPSGNLEPSPEDIRLTQKLLESGKMLDIPISDHLIITRQDFTSLKERMAW